MYGVNPFQHLFISIRNKLGEDYKNLQKWYDGLLHEKNICKKRTLMNIAYQLNNFINRDKEINQIQGMAIYLNKYLYQIPERKLQIKAAQYFNQNFYCLSVEFQDKNFGVQFGKIINAKLIGKKLAIIKYYVKTHRGGLLLDSNCATVNQVDFKELYVYKILQKSGFGAESHFFYDDLRHFYIATKDAGYDQNNEKGEFLTYHSLKKKYPLQMLQKDETLAKGIIAADILMRILRLGDIISNPGNFGIAHYLNNETKIKIIDFTIVDNSYLKQNIFSEWLKGNKQHIYKDQLVSLIIQPKINQDEIDTKYKFEKGLQVFSQIYKADFANQIQQAFEDISTFIKDIKVSETEQFLFQQNIKILKNYKNAILTNYKAFCQGMQDYN